METNKIYQQGFTAGVTGVSPLDCPYRPANLYSKTWAEYGHWMVGYFEGQKVLNA